jgi:hypothetical protein
MSGPRGLLQVCCLLDDSAAIIKWGGMAKERADNVEVDSRAERRFVQWNHDSVENVLDAAVGMVLAASAPID